VRLLVTAGPTCEDIDDVRYLTNRSGGRMGYAVAGEAARRGHRVELVSGPTHLSVPPGVELTAVRSALDMLEACQRLFPVCGAMVAAAAVADYRPARRQPGKLRKADGELVLHLVRNPDVAARLAALKRPEQVVIGFALEASDICESRSSAEAKLADKKQDMTVLNGPAAMGADGAEVSFFAPESGWTEPEVLDKGQVAVRIVDYLEARLGRPDESESRGRAQGGN
jgi:phosphopantothenoylcysteine decarboxylase/phosphopantothenate--cysteine ligase